MNTNLFYTITPSVVPVILLCDTAHIRPPYIHFKRQVPEYILYYIHSGELAIREENREYFLTEGDYILLDPSCEHEGLRSTACDFTYVHFTVQGIQMSADSIPESVCLPKNGSLDAEDLAEAFNNTLLRLLSHTENSPAEVWLQSNLLCELLALLALQYRRRNLHAAVPVSGAGSYVPALKRYLAVHYAGDISSRSLEEMFHCNFDYLNRIFKKTTGSTIFATLNRIRIENAKKYLATGLYTCSEVAAKCGFHDVYYFSRVFKKTTGITPAGYRTYETSFHC